MYDEIEKNIDFGWVSSIAPDLSASRVFFQSESILDPANIFDICLYIFCGLGETPGV